MTQRVGGIIQVQVDGLIYKAKGDFTYNLGNPKRMPVMGSDTVHGFTEEPQIGFIEGEFTDMLTLKMGALTKIEGATVTIKLGVGKMFVLNNAYYAGEGTVNTKEGNIGVRFEGRGEEVKLNG